MLGSLKIGTVLVQTDTFIPDSVWVQRETFCCGWQTITNLDGSNLDRQIRSDGWNFMFLGGALRSTSWGSWSGIAIRCAAIRVLKKIQATKFNAFEITAIRARHFLGIPYVIVIGHSRHIQKSPVLQTIAERIHQADRIEPSSISNGIAVAPVRMSRKLSRDSEQAVTNR